MLLIVVLSILLFGRVYAEEENTAKEAELTVLDHTEVAFEDAVGHWAEEYIDAAAKKQLFKGDTNGRFNPDDNITRAQFVTVLWRMSGSGDVSSDSMFSDIADQTDEFRSAIGWAHKNGYVNGVSETIFEPGAPLTREAAMKILYFYSGDEGNEFYKFSRIYDKTFLDSKDISEWAIKPMYWGLYNGLLAGTSERTLAPKGIITRAQLAKILIKYIDIVE